MEFTIYDDDDVQKYVSFFINICNENEIYLMINEVIASVLDHKLSGLIEINFKMRNHEIYVHSPWPSVVGDDWGRGKVKGSPSSWSGQYIKVKCFTVIGPAQLLLIESVQLDA